jgi:nucleoside-diphosphate-sugar epimerase
MSTARRSASPAARAASRRVPSRAPDGAAPPAPGHTILITGATGYGGRWLVKRALDTGYTVRAADLRPPAVTDGLYDAPLDPRAEWVQCDVTRDDQVAAAVQGVHCECIRTGRGSGWEGGGGGWRDGSMVVPLFRRDFRAAVWHAAALVPYNLPRAYGAAALHAVNTVGTARVWDAAVAAGVRQFVLASSTGVVFAGE